MTQNYDTPPHDEGAYTHIQILDKRIEPDKTPTRVTINRNIVMGNIKAEQMKQYDSENRYSRMILETPDAYGGWFLKDFADMSMDNIEFAVTLSRSVEGFNQKQLNTNNTNQTISDGTQKRTLSDMFRRKPRD